MFLYPSHNLGLAELLCCCFVFLFELFVQDTDPPVTGPSRSLCFKLKSFPVNPLSEITTPAWFAVSFRSEWFSIKSLFEQVKFILKSDNWLPLFCCDGVLWGWQRVLEHDEALPSWFWSRHDTTFTSLHRWAAWFDHEQILCYATLWRFHHKSWSGSYLYFWANSDSVFWFWLLVFSVVWCGHTISAQWVFLGRWIVIPSPLPCGGCSGE